MLTVRITIHISKLNRIIVRHKVKLGYNELGYNKLGYNELGYNELGYNELGYNELGYNEHSVI